MNDRDSFRKSLLAIAPQNPQSHENFFLLKVIKVNV